MALIQSTAISSADDFEIEQSLRLTSPTTGSTADASAGKYLKRVPTSTSNRKTATLSCWLKRSVVDQIDVVIAFGESQKQHIRFQDDLDIRDYNDGSSVFGSAGVYRDVSAWYHLVVAIDTTQGTAGNRVKAYINGESVTSGSYTAPTQNQDWHFNTSGQPMYIGVREWSNATPGRIIQGFEGYLAEFNWIDGQALTPADFGETGTYGEWKPIEYSGTYGTNGFYLPFKQDYTVEGFNAVTYRGNNTAGHYIGGVGFQPDFVWTKKRNGSNSHRLVDSVRGATKTLMSDDTGAEGTENTVTSFETDGFTVGAGNSNNDGGTYVAWNWDMSNPASNVGSTGIQFDNSDDDIVFELGTALGTGSFTVEYWTYFDSLQNFDTIFSTTRSTTGFNSGTDANGMAVWYSLGDDRILESASGTYATGQWYHTAYVRNGTTLKVYVNGVEKDSATDNNDYSEQTASVGALDGASEFSGIILDSLRVSNVARYTSNNFETPQARFTSDSNTLFLLNAPSESSTTLTDSSSNSLSLTITGTSVVSPSGSKPAFTNTTGDITSTVRANPTYGQSIVSWNGTGSGSSPTIGHGLNSAPDCIIVKRRSSANGAWPFLHEFDTTKYLQFQDVDAASTGATVFDNTAPTSSVFTVNATNAVVNASGHTYIAYCWHSVTGYSKFGSYSGTGSNVSVTTGFAPAFTIIKRTDTTENWFIFDNTREPDGVVDLRLTVDDPQAEATVTTGLTYTSTGFTVTSTNGAFNASGGTYIYMAFADKREYAYWLDQSGNNNDWTSNNLTESDISVDSPTNNFCTMNPLFRGAANTGDVDSAHTLSEGNLKIRAAANKMLGTTIIPTSGKWYAEFYVNAQSTYGPVFGWVNNEYTQTDLSTNTGLWKVYSRGAGDQLILYPESASSVTLASAALHNGDIIQFAWDCDSGKAWIGRNNTWYNSSLGTTGNPSTGANPTITTTVAKITNDFTPYIGSADDNSTVTLNFGQDSSFAGNKTAQGNQDGNDIGDFYYTPPTGFLALCTKNLPDVDVVPSKHFNTITYTGTDADNRAITGVGFQPDFAWFKRRNTTTNHGLFDVLRGANKRLSTNLTDAEFSDSNALMSFDSDGYTVSSDGTTNAAGTYVAWNWKANGSGSSNTTGSINTTATSANVDAGFSIVSYTGNGTAGATVGHGLSKAPEMIIHKQRTDSNTWWAVFHKDNGNAQGFYLNDTRDIEDFSSVWNSTSPSSSVITFGTNNLTNENLHDYVLYAFHSVDGYSKVGSYKGNGNADGTFVYTGFRPAYVMIKPSSRGGHWMVANNKSSPSNVVDKVIFANASAGEYTDPNADCKKDFFSNGFKIRTTDDNTNENNATYIYIAFAETPFKYSNAR